MKQRIHQPVAPLVLWNVQPVVVYHHHPVLKKEGVGFNRYAWTPESWFSAQCDKLGAGRQIAGVRSTYFSGGEEAA